MRVFSTLGPILFLSAFLAPSILWAENTQSRITKTSSINDCTFRDGDADIDKTKGIWIQPSTLDYYKYSMDKQCQFSMYASDYTSKTTPLKDVGAINKLTSTNANASVPGSVSTATSLYYLSSGDSRLSSESWIFAEQVVVYSISPVNGGVGKNVKFLYPQNAPALISGELVDSKGNNLLVIFHSPYRYIYFLGVIVNGGPCEWPSEDSDPVCGKSSNQKSLDDPKTPLKRVTAIFDSSPNANAQYGLLFESDNSNLLACYSFCPQVQTGNGTQVVDPTLLNKGAN